MYPHLQKCGAFQLKTSLCNFNKFGRNLHGARNSFEEVENVSSVNRWTYRQMTDHNDQKKSSDFSAGELKLNPRHTFYRQNENAFSQTN